MRVKTTIIIFLIFIATSCFAANDYLGGTFFGTEEKNSISFVKLDNNGDVYVTGKIGSINLTNIDGFNTNFNSSSETLVFIAKFDKDLKNLKAFTYLGDSYSWPYDFKIGKNGDVYIVIKSFDLGLNSNVKGYDTNYTKSGQMLVRLSSDLKNIKNYTYLYNIADIESFTFNNSGDIVLTGYKYTVDNHTGLINYEVFIGIISSDLTQLKKTYVYGENDNKKKKGTAIFIDKEGYIYQFGYSFSENFPNQLTALSGETWENFYAKIFISKFDQELSLIKTTFIATTRNISKVFTGDNNGNLFLSFRSDSTVFKPNNKSEAYYPVILKVDSDLTKIKNYFYTNYYPEADYIYALQCDKNGYLFVGGSTFNYGDKFQFPFTEGAWHATNSSHGVGMLLVLDNNLSKLQYATIIGGYFGADTIYDLDITSDDIVYVAGFAQTANFPVGDSGYQTSCAKDARGSCYDGFIARFAPFALDSASNIQLSSEISGTHVKINWTANSQYTGYILYYAPYPYTSPDTIGSIDVGNIDFLEFDLWQGAAYYIAIRPYDKSGNFGDFSNISLIEIK